MKKNLILFLILLFFTACNNIEKSREEILTVSSERDIALESVRDVGRNLSGELERWAYYQSEIMKGQESLPALSSEELATLNKSLGDFSNYNAQFSAFVQEIGAFAKAFDDQLPQLEAMKQALEGKGKFEGKLNRTLDEIRKTNEETKGKVKIWEERLIKMGQEIEVNYKKIAVMQGRSLE
jgi:hypothetical protein